MNAKKTKNSQLFYGNPKWTSKRVHALRRFARHKKIEIGLFKAEFPVVYKVKKLGKTKQALARLLSDLSPIRDLDVLLQILRARSRLPAKLETVILAERKSALNLFQNLWPLKKRRHLLKKLTSFKRIEKNYDFKKRKLKVTEILILDLLKKTKALKPKTKERLHQLRRMIRKINYLLHSLHLENREFIQIQNSLGQLHDLEIVQKQLTYFSYSK